MSDDALWLDGNALGGVLAELFGTDVTQTPRGCRSCGAVRAVGSHRLYRGAGLVLRCPACGDLAARIVVLPDRTMVELIGSWRLELALGSDQPPSSLSPA